MTRRPFEHRGAGELAWLRWAGGCCLLLLAGCVTEPKRSGESILVRARRALEAGQIVLARDLLLDRGSRSPEEELLLGRTFRRLGEPEAARRVAWKARDGAPTVGYQAGVMLGELALERGDPWIARTRFREAHGRARTALDRARALAGEARAELLTRNVEAARALRKRIGSVAAPGVEDLDAELTRMTERRSPVPEVVKPPNPAAAPQSRPLVRELPKIPAPRIVPRARWSARRIRSSGDPVAMGAINRITLHHTAAKTLPPPGLDASGHRLRRLQVDHQDHRGWADLGYHFVIDRAGRIFEGRALKWQGAHAGNNDANRHNVGVALIGDLDRYPPSEAQKRSLLELVRWVCATHGVRPAMLHGHGDVARQHGAGGTACPGRYLVAWLPRLRRLLAE